MNKSGLGIWWASLALINAGLAQAKGRSRWYWFLISLFLGPVATLLIVVWSPRVETTKAGTGTQPVAATEH
ncbi:MAG TPA: hypothetical protein VGN37_04625 [Actinocatenispora sp.]